MPDASSGYIPPVIQGMCDLIEHTEGMPLSIQSWRKAILATRSRTHEDSGLREG